MPHFIKLTCTDGYTTYANINRAIGMNVAAEGVTMIHYGPNAYVHVTETPEQILALINDDTVEF